jgi:hypothetical protein
MRWSRDREAMTGGSGGGRPHMAQGGVGDPARLSEALQGACRSWSAPQLTAGMSRDAARLARRPGRRRTADRCSAGVHGERDGSGRLRRRAAVRRRGVYTARIPSCVPAGLHVVASRRCGSATTALPRCTLLAADALITDACEVAAAMDMAGRSSLNCASEALARARRLAALQPRAVPEA